MSWADVARIKSRDEALFCSHNAPRIKITREEKISQGHGLFFEGGPLALILGPPRCKCKKTGHGCDQSDCGYTQQ